MAVRTYALVLALVFAAGPFSAAQERDDPLIREFERFVAASGGQKKLLEDAEYQRSRAGWDEAGRIIKEAIEEQDRALAGSQSDIDRVMTLYASRAASRGKPVDHYLQGRMLGLRGHLEDAYHAFSMALQQDRFFFWAWDGLGVYHTNKENWAEAQAKFERVIQLNRNYLKSAFGRAQCLFRAGELQGASLQLREILDHPSARDDPQIIRQTRLLLAEAFRTSKDYDAAIRELTILEKEGMKDIRLHAMRAWCAKQLERWKDAIADYDAILRLDGSEYRYLVQKADCLLRLGRNADAIEAFGAYLKAAAGTLDPKEDEAIRKTIDELRARPAIENPKQKPLNLQDLCNTALNSPHAEKRREAIMTLSRHPPTYDPAEPVFNLLRQTFAKALADKDPMVQAKALQQMNERFWDPVRLLNVTKMLARQPYGKDPIVRGMACYQLQNYDPKTAIPVLILAMKEETDMYVFRRIHDSLNSMTLAWIDRILPDDLELRDVSDIRGKWIAWYRKNRDVYRRNEPDGFNLDN